MNSISFVVLQYKNSIKVKSINQVVALLLFLSVSCSKMPVRSTISGNNNLHRIKKTFKVGDVNNNGKKDIATVDYIYDFTNDQVSCNDKSCLIAILFDGKIPPLEIENTRSIYVEKTFDINDDGANEILIFSLTNEGFWNTISVYSLQHNQWKEVAKTKGFLSENRQFKDRVIKSNGNYFLIGDGWEDDLQERSIKQKLS